jgi:hypothetical protein
MVTNIDREPDYKVQQFYFVYGDESEILTC